MEQLIINGEYELPSYEDVKKDYGAKGYAQVKGDLQSYRAELAEKSPAFPFIRIVMGPMRRWNRLTPQRKTEYHL